MRRSLHGPISRPEPRRGGHRRGNYSLMLAVAIIAVLGFGALAIDVAYMRYAQAQAQDVADAASQAALIVLRQTGSTAEATAAAQAAIDANSVAGEAPDLVEIDFGNWDDSDPNPAFLTGGAAAPNAVRVTVGRESANAVPYQLARIFGKTTFGVRGTAVSATRSFQIVIVLDITGSWHEGPFANARAAVLVALDMLTESASGVDEVGMTIFTNRYAWEYTPFTQISIPANADAVRDDWEVLNIASKAPLGMPSNANPYDGVDCKNPNTAASYDNDFTTPAGGCYPLMPREYKDEPGTDHSTGMGLAKQMFEERSSTAVYRAMIVVTDGIPNGLGATSGQTRAAQGFVEDRWREYLGPVPRTTQEIRNQSISQAQALWNQLQVNTWIVSLVQYDAQMMQDVPEGGSGQGPGVPQGDGYWVVTNNSAELAEILAQIISEMPLAIVE